MRISVLIFFALVALLHATEASARQYKSRVFNDSEQELTAAELQNIEALEQAFTGYQDDYQIASAGQYLAREMVKNGEYEKAVQYYYQTLKSGGLPLPDNTAGVSGNSTAPVLAAPVLRQLRMELAQVLLRLNRPQEVIVLFDTSILTEFEHNITEQFLMARAQLALQQFHQVVALLKPIVENLAPLTSQQLKQLSAILYQAKALPLVVEVLTELRTRAPEDIDIARQLTGLHIRLEQYQQALDIWSLLYSQGLLQPSQDPSASQSYSQDILLLADLYARQQTPEKAARLLQQALQDGSMDNSHQYHYRLFEFWYRAKEIENAKKALWQNIQLSRDLQHALILAELLQQDQDWPALERLVLLGCESVLPDQYVGRINLFYGIALHKQGKNSDARRAFINASLVSGVKTQAREWLAFMAAAPASIEESSELWGPCLPDDPQIALPKNLASTDKEQQDSSTQQASEITDKPAETMEKLTVTVLPANRLYTSRITTTAQDLQRDIKTKTFTLLKNLMRSGGQVEGNMHLLFTLESPDSAPENENNPQFKLGIGFPYSGVPSTRAGFKVVRLAKRNAVVRHYQGPGSELQSQWQALVIQALGQGMTPTGDAVTVFVSDTSGTDQLDVELQLMVE